MSQKKLKTEKLSFYALETLGQGSTPDGFEDSGIVVSGDIKDYIVVSVPNTASAGLLTEIGDKLKEAFGTKKILVVTHNIQFLKLRKMDIDELYGKNEKVVLN